MKRVCSLFIIPLTEPIVVLLHKRRLSKLIIKKYENNCEPQIGGVHAISLMPCWVNIKIFHQIF